MEFGELLRQLREEAGLSQGALARAAGMASTNVNRIERSKQGLPRKTTVIKLLNALNIPLTDERAQQLLHLAGTPVMPPATLFAPVPMHPGRIPNRSFSSLLNELRLTLLHALDVITELDQYLNSSESNQNE